MVADVYSVETERYGALDSEIFNRNSDGAHGEFIDAHILRTMARNSNRLMIKGHTIANFTWQVDQTSGAEYTAAGMVSSGPSYQLVAPRFVASKKVLLSSFKVYVQANIPSGDTAYLTVRTTYAPAEGHRRANSGGNALVMAGTGSFARYTSGSIRMSPGPYEEFEISVWANQTGSSSPSGVGSPTSGQYDNWAFPNLGGEAAIVRSGSTWSGLDDGFHYIIFQDSSGNSLTRPHLIVGNDSTTIDMVPNVDFGIRRMIDNAGKYFEIIKVDPWEMASITLYAEDLEV